MQSLNWSCRCGNKKSNSVNDLRTPILENESGPPQPHPIVFYGSLVLFFASLAGIIWFFSPLITGRKYLTTYKPEFRLDSLLFCTTNTTTSNNNNLIGIWDIKLDITNTNNYSYLCIDQFEVSILFSNNNSYDILSAKTEITQTCVSPLNHTCASVLADASSLLDQNQQANGTMVFDLKIHGHLWFLLRPFEADYDGGDVVCRGAKVDLLASSYNSSSCASMVGDPIMCSYV